MNKSPIGVFDSGIGGLSTLKELHRQLPGENFVYLADLLHSPYGNKTAAQLKSRARIICDFMSEQQVKAIVVACNTATATTIMDLRSRYSLPIIGVEPGIKPATTRTLSGVVGILATALTLASPRFQALIDQFHGQVKIICQPCPGLADAIEKGKTRLDERRSLLQRFIAPLIEQDVDILVLGCTHYPLIVDEIRQVIPEHVEIIDTSPAIARQVVRQLEVNSLISRQDSGGRTTFFSGNHTPELAGLFSYYWGETIELRSFNL